MFMIFQRMIHQIYDGPSVANIPWGLAGILGSSAASNVQRPTCVRRQPESTRLSDVIMAVRGSMMI